MEQSNKKEQSLYTALNEMILSQVLDTNVSFPAKVKDYDKTTQRATIIPLTKSEFYKFTSRGVEINETDNGGFPETYSIEIPPIPDVPVNWTTTDNGNCYIHLPLKEGDLGMAIVSTRSLENYLSHEWKRGEQCFPLNHQNVRHHDYSDSWFIPGCLPKNKTIENLPDDAMVIKNRSSEIILYPNDGIELAHNDVNIEVKNSELKLGYNDVKITIDALGKMKIENNTGDLFAIVKDLIVALLSATVTTAIGQQPLDAATLAVLTSLQAQVISFI